MSYQEIDYRAKFSIGSDDNSEPISICRRIVTNEIFKVEHCNAYQGWSERPELISYWVGEPDEGYFSGPEGEPISAGKVSRWVKKWEKNW